MAPVGSNRNTFYSVATYLEMEIDLEMGKCSLKSLISGQCTCEWVINLVIAEGRKWEHRLPDFMVFCDR